MNTQGTSNTITSVTKDNMVVEPPIATPMLYGKHYRIRKLTPRECFRLQGVRDSDIDKIQDWRDAKGKPISNAQQYKMAGNSITVDVLYYIFKNLFVEPVKIARQMSIFDVL